MRINYLRATALAVILLGAMPAAAQTMPAGGGADQTSQALLARIEKLEAELAALRAAVQQSKETASAAKTSAETTAGKLETVKRMATIGASAAYSGAESDAKWHLAGYADTTFVVNDGPTPSSFIGGQINPILHFQYKDLLMFESELEFTTSQDGETNTELEYAQFDVFLNDYATLVAGKYISPIGQFKERLHPSWINKVVSMPAGFGHDGVQPGGDTGIQLRGALPAGQSRFTYALAVGNGPQTTFEGGVRLEGSGNDDNKNKSLGGRLGFLPLPYLEFGGSLLTAKVSGYQEPSGHEDAPVISAPAATPGGLPDTARFTLWGADAAYTKGALNARFEYLDAHRAAFFTPTAEDPGGTFLPRLGMKAWYGQVSYRLSGLGDSSFIHNLEPVLRYGEFSISGQDELEEENAQNRYNVGLNYWLAPTVVTKAGVEWRDFKVPGIDSETLYQFQIAYGF